MKNILTIKYFCLLLICGINFSGCVKRELDYRQSAAETGILELTVNWSDGVAPAGTRLMIYQQTGEFHKEITIGAGEKTFSCELEAGTYKIMTHNTDHENIGFSNMDNHSSATAIVGSDVMPESGTVIAAPHNMYNIGLHDQGEVATITAGQTTSLSATPVRLTHEVKFLFRISGLHDVSNVKGQLKGVAPGVLLGSNTSLPISCYQLFVGVPIAPANSKAEAGTEITYQTSLEFFDLLASQTSAPNTNPIDVAITDDQDRTYLFTVDLTSTVDQIISENNGTLPIEIPLDMEVKIDPQTNNVTATVTPWDNSGTGGGNPRPQ